MTVGKQSVSMNLAASILCPIRTATVEIFAGRAYKRTRIMYTLFIFYMNKVYKNIEAENGKILTIC